MPKWRIKLQDVYYTLVMWVPDIAKWTTDVHITILGDTIHLISLSGRIMCS